MFRHLILPTTAALLIATGAQAGEAQPDTASKWQAEVERRIDRELQTPMAMAEGVHMTEVSMRFDAQGAFEAARVRKTSGIPAVDAEALRVANSITYPRLPSYLQGKPQNVAMQIFFGSQAPVTAANRQAHKAAMARAAETDANRAHAEIAGQPDG